MSKLYDALSRLRPGAADAGTELWQALEAKNAEASSLMGNGHSVAEIPAVEPGPAVLGSELRSDVQFIEPAVADRTGDDARHMAHLEFDKKERFIPHTDNPMVVEHYRRLRTKILQQQAKLGLRTLMVTSANPREGKSVTVMNLALSFAMLPSIKVLVVDGDLRKGTFSDWLGLKDDLPGLGNLIEGTCSLDDVLMSSDEFPMHFIMRGNSRIPPAELMNGPKLKELFKRIGEGFDLVLVDSPPINLVAEAHMLASSCDAILMIARAFSTSRKAFEKAVQELAPYPIIGTVLNAGAVQASSRYSYYR